MSTRLFWFTTGVILALMAFATPEAEARVVQTSQAYPAPYDPQLNTFYEYEPIRLSARYSFIFYWSLNWISVVYLFNWKLMLRMKILA